MFEKTLSDFIRKLVTDDEVILVLEKYPSNNHGHILKNYRNLCKEGNNGSIYDLLYLTTLPNIIEEYHDRIPNTLIKV